MIFTNLISKLKIEFFNNIFISKYLKLFEYRYVIGGGNSVNSYVMGSSAATFASHPDVVSMNTTPMNTVLSSTLVGSSMTSIIKS